MESLTFPDSLQQLQASLKGVHAASAENTINIQKFLSDDAPHNIQSLLKDSEYSAVGISCPGNIIQQFSSSHKLVRPIFGTLELHEFLFPVIVRHQTSDTRDEVSMSSRCYQPARPGYEILTGLGLQ